MDKKSENIKELLEGFKNGTPFVDYLPIILPNGFVFNGIPQKCSNCRSKILTNNSVVANHMQFQKIGELYANHKFDLISYCVTCNSISTVSFTLKNTENKNRAVVLALIGGEWVTLHLATPIPLSKLIYNLANNIYKYIWLLFNKN